MSLRDYLARLAYEHRARDAWFGEWHAHPLALATDTATWRARRRFVVDALCADMGRLFARRERAK